MNTTNWKQIKDDVYGKVGTERRDQLDRDFESFKVGLQLKKVREVCHVPLIASGGAGTMEHFLEAFRDADVDGALAASVFHKQIINIGELKAYLATQGVEIRIC